MTGALGFELIGGQISQLYGINSLNYAVSYTIEETLEMLGIAFLIYTICSYIGEQFPQLTVKISN